MCRHEKGKKMLKHVSQIHINLTILDGEANNDQIIFLFYFCTFQYIHGKKTIKSSEASFIISNQINIDISYTD